MSKPSTKYASEFVSEPRSKAMAGQAIQDLSAERDKSQLEAMILIAHRFPRDEQERVDRIVKSCQRRGVAEEALYYYPQGGDMVEGPTIRLAELMVQTWGHCDFGFAEVDRNMDAGESQMESYCWDIQNNVRRSQKFVVPHKRKSSGKLRDLTEPRQIYEMTANKATRRLRTCMLACLPSDVVNRAKAECKKTVESIDEAPDDDQIESMVESFQRIGVTEMMLRRYLGCEMSAITGKQYADLKKVFGAIRDGYADRGDYFDTDAENGSNGSSGLSGQFNVQTPDTSNKANGKSNNGSKSKSKTTSKPGRPTPPPPEEPEQSSIPGARADDQGDEDDEEPDDDAGDDPADDWATDYTQSAGWASAKRSIASLVTACEADIVDEQRQAFYQSIAERYGKSDLTEIPPETLEDEAETLREYDSDGSRSEYILGEIQ